VLCVTVVTIYFVSKSWWTRQSLMTVEASDKRNEEGTL
jgi:hypothetical protein